MLQRVRCNRRMARNGMVRTTEKKPYVISIMGKRINGTYVFDFRFDLEGRPSVIDGGSYSSINVQAQVGHGGKR